MRKKKEDSIIRTGAQGDIGDRKKGIGGTPCWKLYNTLQIPLAGTGLGRVSAHGYDENLVIREYIDCIKYMATRLGDVVYLLIIQFHPDIFLHLR